MKRYSLANYILSVEPNDESLKSIFGTLSVGGEGSYLDSIGISTSNSIWSTSGYSTGAWVHDKNLSRVGTCEISLNQLSDSVSKFKSLCQKYYSGDYQGCTLTLSDNIGNIIATCVDCYVTQIPQQSFSNTASNQNWSFTCGEITYL